MPSTVAEKQRIKDGFTLLTLNAPADFKKEMGPLPKGVTISPAAKNFNQVHWFVKDKNQLEKELGKVLKLVKDEVVCWVYYPKGTSGIQTDLTRDKGWDSLLNHDELHWISLISFNDTWSTFAFRLKTDADSKKKAAKPTVRPIFEYVDPKTKTVRLPDDLQKALVNNKKASSTFDLLSFTNKKEYIEWIITAKREETRTERVQGTLERLSKGWKNPGNR